MVLCGPWCKCDHCTLPERYKKLEEENINLRRKLNRLTRFIYTCAGAYETQGSKHQVLSTLLKFVDDEGLETNLI